MNRIICKRKDGSLLPPEIYIAIDVEDCSEYDYTIIKTNFLLLLKKNIFVTNSSIFKEKQIIKTVAFWHIKGKSLVMKLTLNTISMNKKKDL